MSLEQLGQIVIKEFENDDASDISSIKSENLSSSRVQKSMKPTMIPSTSHYEQEVSNMLSKVNLIDKALVNISDPTKDNQTTFIPSKVYFSRSRSNQLGQSELDRTFSHRNLRSEGKESCVIDHKSNYLQRNVAKWNISFNGSIKGPSIKRFLFKLEHLATANKVPSEILVTDISYVLKESSAEWYWTYIERNPEATLAKLKDDLIKRFLDRQTDDDRRHLLESRKQRYKESFQDFYSDMLSISLQFETPLSDTELMYMIRRNMRAGLQDKLVYRHFPSLEQMVQLCIAYEDTWFRTGFIPEMLCQNRRQINEIDVKHEDTLMNDPYHNSEYNEEVCAFNFLQQIRPVPNLFHKNQYAIPREGCWNCNKSDHIFKNCKTPLKHRFCFGCGAPGILKPYCNYCKQNSENGRKRTGNGCTWPPKIKTAQMESPKVTQQTISQNQNSGPNQTIEANHHGV